MTLHDLKLIVSSGAYRPRILIYRCSSALLNRKLKPENRWPGNVEPTLLGLSVLGERDDIGVHKSSSSIGIPVERR